MVLTVEVVPRLVLAVLGRPVVLVPELVLEVMELLLGLVEALVLVAGLVA